MHTPVQSHHIHHGRTCRLPRPFPYGSFNPGGRSTALFSILHLTSPKHGLANALQSVRDSQPAPEYKRSPCASSGLGEKERSHGVIGIPEGQQVYRTDRHCKNTHTKILHCFKCKKHLLLSDASKLHCSHIERLLARN